MPNVRDLINELLDYSADAEIHLVDSHWPESEKEVSYTVRGITSAGNEGNGETKAVAIVLGYEIESAKDLTWKSNDGTLECFGKADEYTDPETGPSEFHCAHLETSGDCNEQLRKECWKRSKTVKPTSTECGIPS